MANANESPLAAERYSVINRSTGEIIPCRHRFVLIDRPKWQIIAGYLTYEAALEAKRGGPFRNSLIGILLTENDE